MRFFRGFFWVGAVHGVLLGALHLLFPSYVSQVFEYSPQTPLFLLQFQGLFLIGLGLGYALVAEQPSKSADLAIFGGVSKALLPLLALLAYFRNELGTRGLLLQGTEWLWLPFFVSYFVWLWRRPNPERFLQYLGVFGTYFRRR